MREVLDQHSGRAQLALPRIRLDLLPASIGHEEGVAHTVARRNPFGWYFQTTPLPAPVCIVDLWGCVHRPIAGLGPGSAGTCRCCVPPPRWSPLSRDRQRPTDADHFLWAAVGGGGRGRSEPATCLRSASAGGGGWHIIAKSRPRYQAFEANGPFGAVSLSGARCDPAVGGRPQEFLTRGSCISDGAR